MTSHAIKGIPLGIPHFLHFHSLVIVLYSEYSLEYPPSMLIPITLRSVEIENKLKSVGLQLETRDID